MTNTANAADALQLIRAIPAVSVEGNTLVTELVKGIRSYSVVSPDGEIVARSHRVHVQGTYTLVVKDKWCGSGAEGSVVGFLNSMCA